MLTDDTSRHLAVCDSVPAPDYRAAWEAPRRANASSPPSPKRGAGGAAPAGGTGGVPPVPKTSEGGAGGIAAQAKPNFPLKEGAGQNKTIPSNLTPPPCKIRTIVL